MRGYLSLAVATVATFITSSVAVPIVVHPGNVNDIVITADNTMTQRNPLQLDIVNNYGSDGMYVYVDGKDANNVPCILGTDGTFFYPNAAGSEVPIAINASIATPLGAMGSTTTVTVPDFLQSARIWVSDGQLTFYTVSDSMGGSAIVEPAVTNPEDPSASVPWGFVEFNFFNGTVYANISYVDWVGLAMGMALTLASGETQTVPGLSSDALDAICNDLKAQDALDSAGWSNLCVADANGKTLRVLSPNLYLSANPTAFETYYEDYISQVWTKYASEPLMINTQIGGNNTVSCKVTDDQLMCDNDNRGYPQPTVADIWGCNSGPFAIVDGDNDIHRAIVPRLCAAFTRSTLLLDGGNITPSLSMASYYGADPTNHYSRIVHNYETNNIGYAFSYDDVSPAGENAAGEVAGDSPTLMRITVGGWSDA
ncbi:glycoside hydrolase family 64 protein [Xylariaceae sp. FL1272]|nr:glycoside hydrolase family 64 protein [Xylariaceae sp. FL1272]